MEVWVYVLWLALLPVCVFYAFRFGHPYEPLLGKTFKTCLYSGAAWFFWFALAGPTTCFFTQQMVLRTYILDYWWFAALLPLFCYVASRFAKATLPQARMASVVVLLWSFFLWGIMIGNYYITYGQSPRIWVTRETAHN
jgi:hypothetical protein